MNTKPKKFIPNIITLTNMFLGFLSIGLIFNGDPLKAGTFIIIAAFLDAFDGKTARLLQIESRFGMEFDSMADSISFCVAPSVLIYSLYVDGLNPLVGSIISFMPIMFGTIRLAKFNINHSRGIKKTYTSGLTTPIASITIFSYPIFNDQLFGGYGDPRIALFIVAGVSFLMVSPIHFFKFPLLSFKSGKENTILLLVFIFSALGVLWFWGLFLFPISILFITWNVIYWLLKHQKNNYQSKIEI